MLCLSDILVFMFQKIVNRLWGILSPEEYEFHSDHYMRHNARRLEHLASLNIPVAGKTVLEVGAGIGDHSSYYLDRGCTLTSTEGREKNVRVIKRRFPGVQADVLDMEAPHDLSGAPFDVVHCYGLLYHLGDPERALYYLGKVSKELLLLETCVSFGSESSIHVVDENKAKPSQSYSGAGCRPTRVWIMEELRKHFPFVYIPETQPNHEEYPLDWTSSEKHRLALSRAIFIASRKPIQNPLLKLDLVDRQKRHD